MASGWGGKTGAVESCCRRWDGAGAGLRGGVTGGGQGRDSPRVEGEGQGWGEPRVSVR